MQEKSMDGRVIDEMFETVMEVSVVGEYPSRGMGFEMVGKFIKRHCGVSHPELCVPLGFDFDCEAWKNYAV